MCETQRYLWLTVNSVDLNFVFSQTHAELKDSGPTGGCCFGLYIPFYLCDCLLKYRVSSNRQLPSNSHRPQIVAAQSEALEWNKHHPQIVAAASNATLTHTCEWFLTTVTTPALCCTSHSHGWQQDWEAALTTNNVYQPSPSHSYILYPAVIDVSGLSKEINATLK